VSLNKGFVASSGDYERYVMHEGQRLHHILDPKTGYPTKGPHGVTLISDNLEAINGLGAAIMVAGAQSGRTRLQQMSDVDALIVDANNQLWTSSGMARRLVRS
jgi:thiamine biosynthesis lipoprotein